MANDLFGSTETSVQTQNNDLFPTSTESTLETPANVPPQNERKTQQQDMANRANASAFAQGNSDSLQNTADAIVRTPEMEMQNQVMNARTKLNEEHYDQFGGTAALAEHNETLAKQATPVMQKVIDEDQAELHHTNQMAADYAYINNADLNRTAEEEEVKAFQNNDPWVPSSKESKDKQAAQLYVARIAGELWDESSAGGLTLDTGFMLIPGVQAYQDWELSTRLADSDNPVVSWVGEASTMIGMRERFSKLTGEQQIQVLDAVKENLAYVTDNTLRKIQTLLDISGATTEAEAMFDQANTIGEVTGVAGAAAKAGTITLKARRSGRIAKLFAKEKEEIAKNPMTVSRDVPYEGTTVQVDSVDNGIIADGISRLRSRVRQDKGNPKLAAEEAHLAANSEEVAMSMGMTRTEAAMSAVPVKLNSILHGAAPEVAGVIQKEWARMDGEYELSKISVDSGFGSLLSEEEKKSYLDKLNAALKQEPEVSDVVFGDITDKGFEVSYKYKDPMTGVFEDRTTTEFWNVDAITGNPQVLDNGSIRAGLYQVLSPSVVLGDEASKLFVHSADRNFAQAARMDAVAQKELTSISKELGRKSMKKLDVVLRRGDLAGKEYTYKELVLNNNLGEVPALTDAEFVAYARVRKLARQAFNLHNEELRNTKRAKGIQKLHVVNSKTGEEINFLGKVLDSKAAAKHLDEYQVGAPVESRFIRRGDKVWVPQLEGTLEEVRDSIGFSKGSGLIDAETMYAKGWKIVEMDGSDFIADRGVGYQTLLVHTESEDTIQAIKDTDELIRWHKGWMPLAYKDAHYFVKEVTDTSIINSLGEINKETKTLRYFSDVKEAQQYLEELKKVNPERNLEVLRDGELPAELAEQTQHEIFGGLGTSARKSERLAYGIEGQEAKFESSLESLARSIGRVNNRYSFSNTRTAMIDTVRKQLTRFGVDSRQMSLPELEHAADLISDSHIRNSIKIELSQLRQVMNIPTKASLAQRKFYLDVADGIVLKDKFLSKIPGLTTAIYSFGRGKLPQEWVKAATFHVLLGLFNPSQFIVQAASASAAAAIAGPTIGNKAISHATALHYFDVAKRTKFREQAIKDGLTYGSDKELLGAWERSGLYEATLGNKGAYLDVYDGVEMTKGRIQKLLDQGTFFFEQGELINTRYSFSCAYEEWKKANKGRVLDDEGLREIMASTTKYKTNMSEFNKTQFQKNTLLSIPTQFWQVTTKALEQGCGLGGLSRAEMVRFWTVPMLMFGTNGGLGTNPVGDMVYTALSGAMGISEEDPNPEVAYAIKHGAIGYGIHILTGADVDIGSRVALTTGMWDSVYKFATGSQNGIELLMGPSSTLVQRSIDSGREIAMTYDILSADEMTDEDILTFTKVVVAELASLPSSSRNALAGYMMYESNTMRDSNGRVLWSKTKDATDAFIKGVGISPTSAVEYYENKYGNTQLSGEDPIFKDDVKLATNVLYKIAFYLNDDKDMPTDSASSGGSLYTDDGSHAEKLLRAERMMLNVLHEKYSDDPAMFDKFRAAIIRKVKEGNTTKDQQLSKWIERSWSTPKADRAKLLTSPTMQRELKEQQEALGQY